MYKKFVSYLKDDNGQTSTEYILLLVVVAMLVFKFKNVASERLNNLTGIIFNQADSVAEKIGQDQ